MDADGLCDAAIPYPCSSEERSSNTDRLGVRYGTGDKVMQTVRED